MSALTARAAPIASTSFCTARRAISTTAPRLFRLTRDPNAKKSGKEKATRVKIDTPRLLLRNDDNPLWQKQANQPNMRPFKPELVEDGTIGEAVGFPTDSPNVLHLYRVPRSVEKEFVYTSKPFSVIRQSTVDVILQLEEAKSAPEGPRIVLTGPRGCGKSYLLLQAISYCSDENWIVVSIPRVTEFMDCTRPYHYDARTQTYHLPVHSADLLTRIKQTNKNRLSLIRMQKDLVIERMGHAPKADASLLEAVEFGIRESFVSPLVLEHVLTELGAQKQFPFLLAVDDFQALYCKSQYKTPQYVPIDGYHLSLPRLLLEFAAGVRRINHGAMLNAISLSPTTFRVPIELQEGLQLDLAHGLRVPGSYDKRSADLQFYANGLKTYRVPDQLTTKEAAGIFTAWTNEEALHTQPSDRLFYAKLAEAGGNAREFVWKGIMGTLDT